MARHEKKGQGDGGKERPLPYKKQNLSPRRSDEQDMPAEVRPPTPEEEAGVRKGSTEGLADRDVN